MGQQASAQGQEGQNANPNDPEAAWWCKLLAKVCGAVAGAVAIITGIWTCVSVTPLCIIAGIWMILLGFVVLMFEVPLCCMFLDVTKPIAAFAERRTFFQKALIFGIAAILPVAMCFGVSTVLGCILVFATGVLYGLMALGKKADREQMAANAQGGGQPGNLEAGGYDSGNTGLIDGDHGQGNNPFGGAQTKPPINTY